MRSLTLSRFATGLSLACACVLLLPDTAEAQRRRRGGKGNAMKTATLAPDGTSWVNVLSDLDKDLGKETGGKLSLRIYSGGVQGDEKVVIRKMRRAQLHAGAFTGAGLGQIVPWVRLLELPFTYESAEEVDYVRSKFDDRLRAAFEEKGFVLIGWTDVGFAYMFSQKKLTTVEELKGAKPWLWEGDPLAEAAFKVIDVTATPLALPDVILSLGNGLVDTVYASSMACVGLQWFSKVKYVNDIPLAHGTGGVLIQKDYFDELPEDQQAALRELGEKHGRRLTEISRVENVDAAKTLEEKGIERIPFTAEDAARLRAIGEEVSAGQVGSLYTQEQLDEVRKHLEEFRAAQKESK